ncbi:MAG: OmpA family protein [Deltaproteobacteria bacterium]|nr:OmpA family protein [Deltaproteobacteria bacterium]
MNFKRGFFRIFFGLVFLCFFVTAVPAAEILTEEDFIKKVVVEEDFIKTADNFLILFDTSSSMAEYVDKGAKVTKYDLARKILKQKLAQLPDLGYNSGLYTFAPYGELYPMGPFDEGRYAEAVNSLPAEPKGPTFLAQALRKIDPILASQSGKTVVFIFTDGTTDFAGATKDPEDYTQALADKYNVCFYMIGDATNNQSEKRLADMAKANACSRVIPFKQFVDNPNYITGALYIVKATERIETITESRISGLRVGDVLFGFNQTDIQGQYADDLKQLGMFLQKNSNAYVLLVGYTDSTGPEEYNLGLSNRRADSVAAYLMNNHGVSQDQVVVNWYGEANPMSGNDTAAGRAQNRRVEVAVGGM